MRRIPVVIATVLFMPSVMLAAGPAGVAGPFVQTVSPTVFDKDLRSLPPLDLRKLQYPVQGLPLPAGASGVPTGEVSVPELVSRMQSSGLPAGKAAPESSSAAEAAAALAGPAFDFAGIGFTNIHPPDTQGDVGPNHYIQVVNGSSLGVTTSFFRIWDKAGNPLVPAVTIASLWTTGVCASGGFDPLVVYDQLADRWVITQVGGFFARQCIAVSQTPNPVSGGWFLYEIVNPVTNDYDKLTVWPDAYYLGTQRGYPSSGADAWAFDRANMLLGNPTTMIRFFDPGTFMLPSDLAGSALPPAGAPNVFARFVDGAQFGGADRIELFAFHADFANPPNSTFTALPSLPTAPFDRNLCGLTLQSPCVPQPNTAVRLESLTAWPLWSLQYRNFGVHETLVFNHTVDANGADLAGIRWYELRKTNAGWSILQQGTHAPDAAVHRWMGSAALDGAGNLALGYSVSNATTVFPGIRRSGRLATDPLGTLPQAEVTITPGAGSQTASNRWGDYSAMTVDPVDDRTFWYTTEYLPANGNWETRIASFSLPAGVLPVQRVTNTVTAATTNWLLVTCPAGNKVISGGCDDLYTSTLLRTSAPYGEGWLCIWQDASVNGIPLGFSAHAFCLAGNVDVGLTKVSTTTFSASTNVQLASCPTGKRLVGGGCNDFYTSTHLRTIAPYTNKDWLCIFEDYVGLGFGTDAFCIDEYLDVGLQTVVTQTFSATTNVQVATCPAGKRLLGGGCNDFYTSTRLRTSAPYDDHRWLCVFESYQGLGFGAYAICGNE